MSSSHPHDWRERPHFDCCFTGLTKRLTFFIRAASGGPHLLIDVRIQLMSVIDRGEHDLCCSWVSPILPLILVPEALTFGVIADGCQPAVNRRMA